MKMLQKNEIQKGASGMQVLGLRTMQR